MYKFPNVLHKFIQFYLIGPNSTQKSSTISHILGMYLLEYVPLSPRFDRAVPTVIAKLLLAVCDGKTACLFDGIRESCVATTLVVLSACPRQESARTGRFGHRAENGHHGVLLRGRCFLVAGEFGEKENKFNKA